MGLLILALILIAFGVMLLSKGIRIIQQAEVMVIERLGKYHATLTSGINFIVPFFDNPRRIDWKRSAEIGGRQVSYTEMLERIDMRETVYDFPRQSVITRDNVSIEINALIYFQVTDPLRVVYEITSLPVAIEKLTQTTLRNVIGELDLDQTLTSRETINSKLRHILDDASNKWGVKVNRVELQDIIPPREIKEAMEKQMRAERDKRAAILEAEGLKQAQILKAEGFKEAEIKRAEGSRQALILEADGQAQAKIRVAEAEATAVKTISDTVAQYSNPANYLISLKYIEALTTMTEGKDNKLVYMPFEATGVLGAVGAVRDLISGNGKK
ncbi:Chaperone DnaJ domain protein [Elusimicrobium minutum Pei191]|uniref:Chaperone DnaJ domain protein n=1 Tax=Elusimicrobium minutum (strain Pei191) TaxID=445932 RepID=B2KB96_ELUMP|nr:SPFH domain-containing protein [Elusimicrobium minutum]ACC97918.1 Chaperone DnaJ domain protein [Elusimicrobium minutum Pei191]